MGFKPKSSMKRYYHIKPAHFIYPDEKVITVLLSLFSEIETFAGHLLLSCPLVLSTS